MCHGDANHSDPASAPGPGPELADRLPADAYYHLIRTLRLTLPPPPAKAGATDDPEALLRRDHAAIARIAALVPANAAEADLAAQFVAASEQWKDCLRLANEPDTAPEWARKCRAQALAMMRQANSALRLLLRLQAARGCQQADAAAADRAAWTEHCAIGLMAEALSGSPPNRPLSRPAPLAAAPETETGPTASPPPAEPQPPAPPPYAARPDPVDPDLIAAAERYAARYPERAAAIRRTRRLPSDVRYFVPSEAALASALDRRPHPGLGRARPRIRPGPRGLGAGGAPENQTGERTDCTVIVTAVKPVPARPGAGRHSPRRCAQDARTRQARFSNEHAIRVHERHPPSHRTIRRPAKQHNETAVSHALAGIRRPCLVPGALLQAQIQTVLGYTLSASGNSSASPKGFVAEERVHSAEALDLNQFPSISDK